jgi:hypothetical protein
LAAAAYLSQEVYIKPTTINYQDSTTTIQPRRQTEHKQQPSKSQNDTIPSLAKITSIGRSSFCGGGIYLFFLSKEVTPADPQAQPYGLLALNGKNANNSSQNGEFAYL